MTKYPIYQAEQVDADSSDSINESEGRFYKYWCQHPQLGLCLFKAAVPDGYTAAERSLDWSEKVASELGKLLGLPVAQTEFAIGYAIERSEYISGTVSVDHSPTTQVISGRRFLSLVDPLYDIEQPDGADPYNIENIFCHLETNAVGLPPNWNPPPDIDTGADLMVGYLIFDAWLSATDRHDENWELAILDDGYVLCPTFDHGDSLGVKLSPQERLLGSFNLPQLTESCWWQTKEIDGRLETVEITTLEAFNNARQIKPIAARSWQQRLAAITPTQIEEIFDRIPEGRITPTAARFAIELLEFNRQELLLLYDLYLAESVGKYQEQVQSNLASLKAEVAEYSANPQLTFSDDTLSFMEEFVRDRLERVRYPNPQNIVADPPRSEFDIELKQRLFQRVEENILELENSDNLSMLEAEIRQEMVEEGLIDRQNEEGNFGLITMVEDEEAVDEEGEDIDWHV
jgi:hypothetical protein